MRRSIYIYLISGTSAILIGSLIKYYLKRKRQAKRDSYPKNVVILHQFPPGLHAPSLSPYCLKLETWLRFTKIEYKNEFTMFERSSKGQVPWITLNNNDINDSQFCIEYLTKLYGKDLSDGLTMTEKSVGRAFLKLIEESLKWTMVIYRYKYGVPEDIGIPSVAFFLVGRRILKGAFFQGYSRHTKEELYQLGVQDLKSLETFISNKKYFFGDTPTVEDASLFGFTTQIVYHDSGPLNEYILTECPNLIRHLETIKEEYWPDWNQRVKKVI